MKEPTKKQKASLHDLIHKWRYPLFLNEWYIGVGYIKKDLDVDNGTVTAEIQVNCSYMKARISVYPSFWNGDKTVQEETLVHELCHCHTQPMWDYGLDLRAGKLISELQLRDATETITQRLANLALARQRSA